MYSELVPSPVGSLLWCQGRPRLNPYGSRVMDALNEGC